MIGDQIKLSQLLMILQGPINISIYSTQMEMPIYEGRYDTREAAESIGAYFDCGIKSISLIGDYLAVRL